MNHRNLKAVVRLIARVAGAAGLLLTSVGCETVNEFRGAPAARRPNVISEPVLRSNPGLAEGQRLFMEHCNQCHVGGAAGLAPALNDKPIPVWVIKFQVRKGIGAMPAYPPATINDSQLEDVVTYVRFLRQHPDGSGQG